MKYLLVLLLIFSSCNVINIEEELNYEVYSNYPHFTVSYMTYTGEIITRDINSYEWKKTFDVIPGLPAYLKVVGDSVQTIQARIRFDHELIIEEVKEDSLPVIEFYVLLN